jgi:hypothetical protein
MLIDDMIEALEQLDAAQALRLHSALLALPFTGVAPATVDWRRHIAPYERERDEPSFRPDQFLVLPPGWVYPAAPRAERICATPEVTAAKLRGAWQRPRDNRQPETRYNWEGLVQEHPWLTFDMIVATVLWDHDTRGARVGLYAKEAGR